MDKKELQKKIYARIDELPTLPVVMPRLLAMIEDPKTSASDITGIIEKDPALTSKILKVANSAYYGFSKKISELDRAVALLGFNMVKSLAISIGVMQNMPRSRENINFSEEGLWLHSLAVAVILKELQKRLAPRKGNTDHLFIVGLLHDVGKIVLDQFFYEQFQEVLKHINDNAGEKLHEVEIRVIGIDHCEVAAMLLTRWKFPPVIINPIMYHHSSQMSPETDKNDVFLLRIANILSQELGIGKDGNVAPNPFHEEELDALSVDEKKIGEMRKYSSEISDDVHAFFAALKA